MNTFQNPMCQSPVEPDSRPKIAPKPTFIQKSLSLLSTTMADHNSNYIKLSCLELTQEQKSIQLDPGTRNSFSETTINPDSRESLPLEYDINKTSAVCKPGLKPDVRTEAGILRNNCLTGQNGGDQYDQPNELVFANSSNIFTDSNMPHICGTETSHIMPTENIIASTANRMATPSTSKLLEVNRDAPIEIGNAGGLEITRVIVDDSTSMKVEYSNNITEINMPTGTKIVKLRKDTKEIDYMNRTLMEANILEISDSHNKCVKPIPACFFTRTSISHDSISDQQSRMPQVNSESIVEINHTDTVILKQISKETNAIHRLERTKSFDDAIRKANEKIFPRKNRVSLISSKTSAAG